MRVFSFLLVMVFTTTAFAEDFILQISEYDEDSKSAVIQQITPGGNIGTGDAIRIHTRNGSCIVEVKKEVNSELYAETKECGKDVVREGMRLSYSKELFDQDWPDEDKKESSFFGRTEMGDLPSKFMETIKDRISVFAGYNLSSNLEGKLYADGSVKNLEGENSFSMGVFGQVYDFNPMFALSVGLGYELSRKFTRATFIENNAETVKGIPSGTPRMSLFTLYVQGEAKDLIDKLDAFCGLNYSIPSLSHPLWGANGDFGFQAGARYEVYDNIDVEGLLKISNMNAVNDIGQTTDVSLGGIEVRGRYTF